MYDEKDYQKLRYLEKNCIYFTNPLGSKWKAVGIGSLALG